MGEYYAITRSDAELRHWASTNPHAKEKRGHKYIARDWINGKWVYFYTAEQRDAFRKKQHEELSKRREARRREFFKRVSARLYNTKEDFKDWIGSNARAEVKRTQKEQNLYDKQRVQARKDADAARTAYRVADRYNSKYKAQYKARYADKSRAFYSANSRYVDAKKRADRALRRYGQTPLGATYGIARRGFQAIGRLFRKR